MARRTSISAIDRLGRRLGGSDLIGDADRRMLQAVLVDYNEPMERAQDLIRSLLGIESTGRLKTEKTIVDKVRRFNTRLSKMQDLAGLRIASPMTLDAQDGLVTSICGLFESARVEDRRQEPSAGYRAVHVIVTIDDCSCEIQVRTPWQHAWADLMERLADAVGRGIRYGERPKDPSASLLFDALLGASDAYAVTEAHAATVSRSQATLKQRHKQLLQTRPASLDLAARTERQRELKKTRDRVRHMEVALRQHESRQQRLAAQLRRLSRGLEEGRLKIARGTIS